MASNSLLHVMGDGEQLQKLQLFLSAHEGIIRTALEVYARNMTEVAAESMAAYDRVKDDAAARAAQDNSILTVQGLLTSARIFTESAERAERALEALEKLDE
jgi:hypothetical protein